MRADKSVAMIKRADWLFYITLFTAGALFRGIVSHLAGPVENIVTSDYSAWLGSYLYWTGQETYGVEEIDYIRTIFAPGLLWFPFDLLFGLPRGYYVWEIISAGALGCSIGYFSKAVFKESRVLILSLFAIYISSVVAIGVDYFGHTIGLISVGMILRKKTPYLTPLLPLCGPAPFVAWGIIIVVFSIYYRKYKFVGLLVVGGLLYLLIPHSSGSWDFCCRVVIVEEGLLITAFLLILLSTRFSLFSREKKILALYCVAGLLIGSIQLEYHPVLVSSIRIVIIAYFFTSLIGADILADYFF